MVWFKIYDNPNIKTQITNLKNLQKLVCIKEDVQMAS